MNKRACLVASIFFGSAVSATASPKMVANTGDWVVYSYQRGGKTACYALSVPMKSTPATVDHGENFFLIAPAQGTDRKEPEVVAGYPLKAGSMVELSVDQKSFRMFTKDNTAWLNSTSRASELMKTLRGGRTMVVKAVSARGTNTSYAYSLNGVSAALDRVNRCR